LQCFRQVQEGAVQAQDDAFALHLDLMGELLGKQFDSDGRDGFFHGDLNCQKCKAPIMSASSRSCRSRVRV
jgi:hypothetical protein